MWDPDSAYSAAVTKRAMVRTGLRAAATMVSLAIVVPVWVVLATLAGLEPEHWTGVRLAGVELPGVRPDIVAAPESANVLLSSARVQEERDTGDLAPSYWDADAGQVVLAPLPRRGAPSAETSASRPVRPTGLNVVHTARGSSRRSSTRWCQTRTGVRDGPWWTPSTIASNWEWTG